MACKDTNTAQKAQTLINSGSKIVRSCMLKKDERKGLISIDVALQSFDMIHKIMIDMMQIIIDTKITKDYVRNNFEFQEKKKEIEEIGRTTDINGTKVLLGEPQIIVDKMKDSADSIFKAEYGIENIVIDDAILSKVFSFCYDKKKDSFGIVNTITGASEYIESYKFKNVDYVIFRNMDVAVLINDNIEKFKTICSETDELKNEAFDLSDDDACLQIKDLKIAEIQGYVGDIEDLCIYVDSYNNSEYKLFIKGESGDFVALLNALSLKSGVCNELIFERNIITDDEKGRVRRDRLTLTFNVIENTFLYRNILKVLADGSNPKIRSQENRVFARLNQIRNSIFLYRYAIPYCFNFTFEEYDDLLDIEIQPVSYILEALLGENLYTEISLEHAMITMNSVINFVNQEREKIKTFLKWFDMRNKVLVEM